MTLTNSSSPNYSVWVQLEQERMAFEQERLAFWQAHTGWSDEAIGMEWSSHLTEQSLATRVDHASTPRRLRHGFGATGTSPALVQGADRARRAVDTRGRRNQALQADNTGAANAMTRTNGSNGSQHSYSWTPPMSQQSSNGSKRTRQQTDMAHPASYTHAATPSSHYVDNSARHNVRDVTVMYDVGDYVVSKLSSSSDNTLQSTAKRQRVEAGLSGSNHPPTPALTNTDPYRLSPTTSVDSNLSFTPSFFGMSENGAAMTRQSSMTTSSIVNGMDMMRVESGISACTDNSVVDPFFFGVDSSAFSLDSSCLTVRPSSSSPITGFIDGDMLSGMGGGFMNPQEFSFSDVSPDINNAATEQGYGYCNEQQGMPADCSQAQDMLRSTSDDSTTSASSAELKATQRRRKHIENGKKPIMSKAPPAGTASGEHSKNRPLKALEPGSQRKEAISKTPYVRPQHPKLFCKLCNENPNGFRGEHELKRHWDRLHAEVKELWICVDPGTANAEGWKPKHPVNICKHCKQGKTYPAYYNAAAHLRRAHFCPRKRGRKARGEERESRAGKAGGNWPPLPWFKENGWLKQINIGPTDTVPLSQAVDIDVNNVKDEDIEHFDENETQLYEATPPDSDTENFHINLSAEQLSLAAFPASMPMEFYGYPTPPIEAQQATQWVYTMQPQQQMLCRQPQMSYSQPLQAAPQMEYALSAPPAMMTTNHGNFWQ